MNGDPLQQAVIPPSVLAGVVEIADRRGIDTTAWFDGTGLTAAWLTLPDSRASFRQIALILRRALRDLPPGPVGMRVGNRDLLMTFGILGFALRACETGAQAVELGLRWHQAAGSLMNVSGRRDGDLYAFEFTERAPEPELREFLCEEALCSTLLLIRAILGDHVVPAMVELTYPEPAYFGEYQRFFRCSIAFDAEANRMSVPAEFLTRRIRTHSAAHLAVALDAAKRLADPVGSRADIVAAVEAVLQGDLRRPLTMVEVADHLHLTERSLHRKLAAAGHRYSDIRDRVRCDHATLLLRETSSPIHAVARAVGYSDAREFRRAYIRWTGKAPSTQRHWGGDCAAPSMPQRPHRAPASQQLHQPLG